MTYLKNSIKKAIQETRTYFYHKERNQTARNVLKTIEAERGKLNYSNKKLCKEYALDVFGNLKYAPWLYVYSAYAREFKEGWIPDNYYGHHVIPKINGEYGKICNRNPIIGKLLNVSDSLDICYLVNHLFLNAYHEVISRKDLDRLLFASSDKVVFKLEDSAQGKGIYFYDKETFNLDEVLKLGNGVFQNYIDQHDFFSDFTNNSVATVRITSVLDDDRKISVRAAYFRFGCKNETHVESATAMRIGIDLKNGTLCEDAYFPDWQSTKKLPGNDIAFAGKALPSFHDCIKEVRTMHSRIPFIGCIGWDIIVDRNNTVRLIELNGGHSGIRFNETIQGPCFKGLNWENSHKAPRIS